MPIRPLDLLNNVKPRLWSVRVAFFRGPNCELIELLEDETGYTYVKRANNLVPILFGKF